MEERESLTSSARSCKALLCTSFILTNMPLRPDVNIDKRPPTRFWEEPETPRRNGIYWIFMLSILPKMPLMGMGGNCIFPFNNMFNVMASLTVHSLVLCTRWANLF